MSAPFFCIGTIFCIGIFQAFDQISQIRQDENILGYHNRSQWFHRELRLASYRFTWVWAFFKISILENFSIEKLHFLKFHVFLDLFSKNEISLSKLLQLKCFVSGPVCHFRRARCHLRTGTGCFDQTFFLVEI